jgi:superfamily II DNA helicase RecQ
MPADTPYTYLFRSWRGLLTTAQTLSASLPPGAKLWVHDFDRQMGLMESLHERLTRPGRRQTSSGGNHACAEDDDLPAFLMKLTHEELAALKDAIQQRRAPSKAAAHVRMYTIHSYKGLEAEVVRVAGDVDRESEPNLHYVALTRGTGHVFVDALDEATQAKADQRARGGGGGATQWGEVKTTRTVGAKGGGSGGGGAPRTKPPPLAEQLRALPAETRAVAEALAALRKTRAAETGKPPYTVFPNRVLLALATTRPADVVGLRAIHGVGDKLVASVGAEVLAVLAEAS